MVKSAAESEGLTVETSHNTPSNSRITCLESMDLRDGLSSLWVVPHGNSLRVFQPYTDRIFNSKLPEECDQRVMRKISLPLAHILALVLSGAF
jgi:hypothetical protein